ncbi:ER lumen protein-retaining receptor 1, partial [Eschrichtius robustus]|nr:ER lumen protein-retaining receptor 1 [Eschrichtius robustus]
VVYIACSFTTVWMIYSKFKATYDGNHDTFRVEFLVVPTAILAFLVNHDFTPLEDLKFKTGALESDDNNVTAAALTMCQTLLSAFHIR